MPPRGHALTSALTPSDISVIGPLARTAFHLENALRLMAGPDLLESAGLRLDLPGLDAPLSALRVAVWADDPICPVSAPVRAAVMSVATALAAQGATIDEAARPAFSAEHNHRVFSALLTSAMATRLPDDQYGDLVSRAGRLAADDQGGAAFVLRSQTMRHRDWALTNEARTRIRWDWQQFFEQYDFMITPIMPTSAFAHDHAPFGERSITVDGKRMPYFSQTFWAGLAGAALLPATIVPTGAMVPAGGASLPIGVQIIGPSYGDIRCIQLAQRLEQLGFVFTPPPGCN